MRDALRPYTAFVKVGFASLSMLVVLGSSVTWANTVTVCKASDPTSVPPVTGTFDFVIDGIGSPPPPGTSTSFSLAVGGCQTFQNIGVGPHTITEAGKSGIVVTSITDPTPGTFVSLDLSLRTITVLALDTGDATLVTFFNKSVTTGTQGCTPGFWKQDFHFGFWVGFSPTQLVSSVFAGVDPSLASESLEDALQGGGGPGLVGQEKILLRAAVAALLNASNSSVAYAFTTASIISAVNAAIATGDLTTINSLASVFDNANNGSGGCPLSGQNPG